MQSLKLAALFLLLGFVAGAANAQIEVQLKFSRLQYIAYEPLLATVTITNRAGRAIDLHDDGSERWFGFEITGRDARLLTKKLTSRICIRSRISGTITSAPMSISPTSAATFIRRPRWLKLPMHVRSGNKVWAFPRIVVPAEIAGPTPS